jgi:CBS domain-containing protein
MKLADLCTREVVGIDANASVRQAATLMCDEHVGALVVMTADDPPQVVGVVTDRDLALEVLGRPTAREKSERRVFEGPVRARAVYPAFGTVAAE